MRVAEAPTTCGAVDDWCCIAGFVDLAPRAAGVRAPDEVLVALDSTNGSALTVELEVGGSGMLLDVLEGERLVADAGQDSAAAARDLRCEVLLEAGFACVVDGVGTGGCDGHGGEFGRAMRVKTNVARLEGGLVTGFGRRLTQ